MSQGISFQREDFKDAYADMCPLLIKHYKEIAHHQDIALNVDEETYRRIDDSGALRVFTARDQEHVMLGYALFFVKHNLHYRDSLQAVQDVIFIHPEKRGFGRDFIKWCDDQLKLDGVQAVYHHVKQAHNWGPMLEKMDYKLVDLVYSKRLDKETT